MVRNVWYITMKKIEGICSDLKLKLDRDISNELSKGLFYGDDDYVEKLQGEMEAKQAFTYAEGDC